MPEIKTQTLLYMETCNIQDRGHRLKIIECLVWFFAEADACAGERRHIPRKQAQSLQEAVLKVKFPVTTQLNYGVVESTSSHSNHYIHMQRTLAELGLISWTSL